MNAVEKLLNEGLERDPADWSVRLELAGKLAERDEISAAAELIGSAPCPPDSEDDLSRSMALLGGPVPEARDFVEAYVMENPSSAAGHQALAGVLAAGGQIDRARKHFETACALAPDLKDPELEALLSAADPEPVEEEEEGPAVAEITEEEEEPVIASPKSEPEPEPVSEPEPIVSVRPLSPPGSAKESADAVRALDSTGDIKAPEKAVMIAEPVPDDELAKSPAIAAHGSEADEDRAFIVGEGEMVHAHQKDSDTGTKVSALTMAILVHVGIFALLALVVVSMPRQNPPQLIATNAPNDADSELEQQKIERVQRRPSQSAPAQMQVVSTVAASQVSMPEFETNNLTFDPIGSGDTFGMSMNFTDADGAGMVSFFGSRSKAQKVVFVVDASASMKSSGSAGKTKFQLMKEELTKTVQALPPTVDVQILFFSGPVWVCGEPEDRKDWHQWNKKNFWHYKDGEVEQYPDVKYVKATKSKIRKVVKGIEETKMSYGTDWREPLKMGLNLEPDVLYFMTDGAVGKHPEKPNVVDDVLKFNKSKSNAKINTICLMVPNAVEDLRALADKTRGEFTLVLEDGTPVRGRDIGKKKKK